MIKMFLWSCGTVLCHPLEPAVEEEKDRIWLYKPPFPGLLCIIILLSEAVYCHVDLGRKK